MNQRLCRTLAGPVAAAFLQSLLLPAVAFAQWDDDDGFTFDEEEVEEFGEPMEFGEDAWEDDGWEDDDGWGDDTTDVVAPVALTTVTGIIVPSEFLDPALADQLTSVLLAELGNIDGVTVVGNEALREEFEIMGADLAFECAFDPVCLGRYGRQLSLGRIVVGRVGETDEGNWTTTIDLFETERSSIVNYRLFETQPRTVAVQEALPPQLRLLFGIRDERVTGGTQRTGPSTAQVAMGWTTAALAVGALAGGVVFGLQARGIESDLDDCDLVDLPESEDVVCSMTQVAAADDIDDGKKAATLANVFIGSGLMLGVVSVLLFTVTPGSDIDEDADLARRDRDFRLAPSVTRDGFGLAGSLRF